jgi:hypothetical protein
MSENTIVESRYVTRASRDRLRHIRRTLESRYGLGLVGLIHPVTKEFNHKAVLEMRGGIHPYEQIGYIRDFHIHTLYGYITNISGIPVNTTTFAN